MSCPNCATEMQVVNYDNQIVLHCSNCGGSFFEENSINRISQESAYELSQDKKTTEVSGQEKKCPKDQSILSTMENNESIPRDVILLQCQKCKGIFTFPEDLMNFKKAQAAKINYFKLWGMPLPSLRAVVVLSFVAFVSAATFFRFLLYQQSSLGQAKASDLIKKIDLSQSGYYRFISFTTSSPFISRIIVRDNRGKIVTKIINEKPARLHFTTITDFQEKDEVYYQIFLIDENGKWVKTEERKFDARY